LVAVAEEVLVIILVEVVPEAIGLVYCLNPPADLEH
jgi:hypothetical protein